MRTVLVSKLNAFVTAGTAAILILIPFHAFLAVWAASLFGHYTAFRLWKEFLIIPLFLAAVYLVWASRVLWRKARDSWLLRLMAIYVLLQLLLGVIAYARHEVNLAALAEGLIEDTRLMVFFFIAWVAAARSSWLRNRWQKLVLVPAAIVVGFGLLQAFVLPASFLMHFGYGSATIRPYELVDQNSQFVRVQSTLRGANPLGAYLVVVIAVLAAFLAAAFRRSAWTKIKRLTVFGVVTLVVLYFTYSRSAYLGTALTIFGIGWLSIRSSRIKRWLVVVAATTCVLMGGLALLLRHNTTFEDTFFHTSQLSHSSQSSNQNRTSALESGVRDVVHEPLGRGPGTAGPASVHNNRPSRIAENYFLQIGQETGWLGLGLFIAINVLVAKALWNRRDAYDCLAMVLLVSLVGLALVNMLSHAWADDTLAYLWWGLAGIALTPIMQTKAERIHEDRKESAVKLSS